MQSILNNKEEILEVLDKLLVIRLVIPSLGSHTNLTIENLEASGEGAGEGSGRVIHFSDQTGADPARHLDRGDVHLCEIGATGGTSVLLVGVEVRDDTQRIVGPHPCMMKNDLWLGWIIV